MGTRLLTRICLTGGPCAGKTTALEAIRKELEGDGYAVAVVPEVPTVLFANGFSARSAREPWETIFYVEQMCRVQEALEEAQLASLVMLGGREEKAGLVLLCDRGVTDNRAYVKPITWEAVCLRMNYRKGDSDLQRYDAVIHMETAALGAQPHYQNNAVRLETPGEAAALDAKTLAAWQGHPNVTVVDNKGTFNDKIDRVLTAVYAAVGGARQPVKARECVFSMAWVGQCKKPAAHGDFCAQHVAEKCRCGRQAVRDCDATIGPMVCGQPLCGKCRCH